MSDLHVGVTPWRSDPSGGAESLAAQGERAEQLGFASFWLAESHFAPRAIPQPLLCLAAVAGRTRKIGLGTTSYLLPIRHAVQVAEEVAVLDRLSAGRVTLGIGRGFRSDMFAAFGVPSREKRDRFRAAVELMVRAWRGEPVAYDGDGGPAVHLSPLPVQQPHPPLWVAAFGPKALEQAARLGLPYFASPIESLEVLAENYERHRSVSAEARAACVPVIRTVFVTADAAAARRVSAALAEQNAALAAARAPALRRSASADVAEVALVGSRAQVAEAIARHRERLGLTHLIARAQVPGAEPAEIEASLEALAELAAAL
ncbi:MAG TPA: LLM class flavin-dependent oxidoreductase [Myxococcota bacterium]|nr:LLM class flavin-dependent oxidoreductase [Myxococcota bacterium]